MQQIYEAAFCIGRSSDIICDFIYIAYYTMFALLGKLSWDETECEFSEHHDPISLERQHN